MSGFLAERTEERVAPLGVTALLPWVKWLFKTIVRKGVRTYEFGTGFLLVNHSDAPDTDSSARYGKSDKEGAANTFGDVDEAQDYHEGPDVHDSGALIPREIDWMGARGRRTRGAGLYLVAGRSGRTPLRDPADKGVAHLPSFIQLYTYYHDLGFVKVDNMIRSYMKTERGIVEMVGGDCVRFSEDPAVAVLCFEPATGILGLWHREEKFCDAGIQQTTKMFKSGHFPQATFLP